MVLLKSHRVDYLSSALIPAKAVDSGLTKSKSILQQKGTVHVISSIVLLNKKPWLCLNTVFC